MHIFGLHTKIIWNFSKQINFKATASQFMNFIYELFESETVRVGLNQIFESMQRGTFKVLPQWRWK